jgi:hypothetical protein
MEGYRRKGGSVLSPPSLGRRGATSHQGGEKVAPSKSLHTGAARCPCWWEVRGCPRTDSPRTQGSRRPSYWTSAGRGRAPAPRHPPRAPRFTALRSTLERYPSSRLGKLMRADTLAKVRGRAGALGHPQVLELCDEFMPGDPPEYFFDRWRPLPTQESCELPF